MAKDISFGDLPAIIRNKIKKEFPDLDYFRHTYDVEGKDILRINYNGVSWKFHEKKLEEEYVKECEESENLASA